MPFLSLALLVVDALCIVHAARSGRFMPWAYVVLFLPGIGAAAYVFLEMLPEWRGTPSGRRTIAGVGRALAPEQRYRRLKDDLEVADTIANRQALAAECETLGRFEEAAGLWESVLALPNGDAPEIWEHHARALLGAGRAAEAHAALDQLKAKWPDYQSQDGHLLYARALVGLGRRAEAEAELRELLTYYAGPEPALDLARLLAEGGRAAEARQLASDYVRRIERSPRFTRQIHAEALRELRSLARG